MKWKRAVSAGLLLILLAGCAPAADSSADRSWPSPGVLTEDTQNTPVPDIQPDFPHFPDVPPDAWYAEELHTLAADSRINGYPDGSFRPEAAITVGEYIQLLAGDHNNQNSGLLDGFDCSPERLQRAISRKEAAWLLASAARCQGETLAVPEGIHRALKDYRVIGETYQEAVGMAYGAGLVTGWQDGYYHPEESLRRCEAVVTVARLLDPFRRAEAVIPAYDYASPVPESAAVADSFFADAAFVGNSQMDGFGLYSGLQEGTFLGATSVTVYDVWDAGREELFRSRQFGKIYILLGINEIGYGVETVAEAYDEMLQKFQQLQPKADLYVLSLLPVCEEKRTALEISYDISNASVRALNGQLQQVCNNRKVYFVNLYEVFADENGGLPAELCWNAVHLNVAPHKKWLAYLKTHTA